MQVYHDRSEREPIDGTGDNSRPKKSRKLDEKPYSSVRLLINAQEALGLSYEQTLDSSFALIQAMLSEYSYIFNERNREEKFGEDEGGEFEWVEMPNWDDPSTTTRMKKYKDVGHFIRAEKRV